MKMASCLKKVVLLLLLSSLATQQHLCAADPTDGFTSVQFTDENRMLQKPYDKALEDRYSNVDGVEKFWIYTNDKPFKEGSPTRPRTEIRITGHDYTSGFWQFEGNFFVPQGTSGAIIMQVFGAANEATTLQLRVINGDLKYYGNNVVAANIYRKVTIFIDGDQKLVVNDHGRATFYFKYGVYGALSGSSNYMESRWKGIKLFKK
ncbi:hypothetical protein ACE6H2_026157 [Prunus campanulata]